MIKIDLLPKESERAKKGFRLPDNLIVTVCYAAIAAAVSLNFILWAALIFKNVQYRQYWAAFSGLKPQMEKADILRTDIRDAEANRNTIRQLTASRLIWARKLNKVSEYLPRGMWLTNLVFNDGKLSLIGNVISEKGQDAGLIRAFLNQLAGDRYFSEGLSALELDSITKKEIKGFEASEFVISGEADAKK